MEVLKNAISVLSLLVAILGSIVAIKNLIKNKKNKFLNYFSGKFFHESVV